MAQRDIRIKKRGPSGRRLKPVYLIVAEGKNKTEVLYLSHFQEQGKSYSIRFIKAGYKTDAVSLYNALITKWKEMDLSLEKGDLGFIILDIDNDPIKVQMISSLTQRNRISAIRFVVSNPAFEVWLLLHFKYSTRQYKDGDAVIKELRRYLPYYEKNRDCYEECKGRIHKAVANSTRLAQYYADYEWPSIECNPRTDIGEMISCLEGIAIR